MRVAHQYANTLVIPFFKRSIFHDMNRTSEKELEILKETIEDLREQLHILLFTTSPSKINASEVFEFSGKLDRVIAEFLRVKNEIDGNPCPDIQKRGDE